MEPRSVKAHNLDVFLKEKVLNNGSPFQKEILN